MPVSPTLGDHSSASDPQRCRSVSQPFRPTLSVRPQTMVRYLYHKLVHIVHLADDGLSLHHLQLVDAFVDQFLHPLRVGFRFVLPKCVSRAPEGVFTEAVLIELVPGPQEIAVERQDGSP